MLRKTTPMRAATANKFVNKGEVISVKSERAKKHVLEVIMSETIEQIPNLAPTK